MVSHPANIFSSVFILRLLRLFVAKFYRFSTTTSHLWHRGFAADAAPPSRTRQRRASIPAQCQRSGNVRDVRLSSPRGWTTLSSVNRRGGLALFHFQTLSDLIVAKAQLMLATATGSSPECHVVAGSSTTHAMQHAELDMRWEICAGSNPASQPDVRVLAERIRPELMQIIGFQQQVLQWYYPDLRLNLDLSVTNSSFYHKPSLLLSFECNN